MVVSAGEREGQVRTGAQQPGGVRATTANSVLKGRSIVVLQGFGMGGQQGALDGGLSICNCPTFFSLANFCDI